MRFSYFPGCTDHSSSYEYGRSTEAVLETLGVELVEIEDWNCCGAAATHSLNRLLSLCLPARNISKAQSAQAGPLVIPLTMLMDYMLRSRDLMKGSLIPGVKLFLKGKFPLLPSFIKGRGEIKRIFEKCTKK